MTQDIETMLARGSDGLPETGMPDVEFCSQRGWLMLPFLCDLCCSDPDTDEYLMLSLAASQGESYLHAVIVADESMHYFGRIAPVTMEALKHFDMSYGGPVAVFPASGTWLFMNDGDDYSILACTPDMARQIDDRPWEEIYDAFEAYVHDIASYNDRWPERARLISSLCRDHLRPAALRLDPARYYRARSGEGT